MCDLRRNDGAVFFLNKIKILLLKIRKLQLTK